MAGPFVLRNVSVMIDSVDYSDHIEEVAVNMTAADVDVTAMGAGGKGHLAGIRDDSFTFTAYSDFSASEIHAAISAKFIAAGTFQITVLSNTSTVSTTNPSFTGYNCPALSYTPISGKVGDAAMTPLNFPVSGTITVATS